MEGYRAREATIAGVVKGLRSRWDREMRDFRSGGVATLNPRLPGLDAVGILMDRSDLRRRYCFKGRRVAAICEDS